jgi:hypothetical protein
LDHDLRPALDFFVLLILVAGLPIDGMSLGSS